MAWTKVLFFATRPDSGTPLGRSLIDTGTNVQDRESGCWGYIMDLKLIFSIVIGLSIYQAIQNVTTNEDEDGSCLGVLLMVAILFAVIAFLIPVFFD